MAANPNINSDDPEDLDREYKKAVIKLAGQSRSRLRDVAILLFVLVAAWAILALGGLIVAMRSA